MNPLDDLDPDLNHFNEFNECKFFSHREFNDKFSNSKNSLGIIHINIRSINKNLDEFLAFLSQLTFCFSVVILTETWLMSRSDWLEVEGLNGYHSIRSDRRGGGVSVLVRDDIKSSLINEWCINDDIFESCGVKLFIGKDTYYVMGVYRAPSSNIVTFNTNFFNVIDLLPISPNHVFIAGDFNLDISAVDPPESTNDYLDSFRSRYFLPAITVPTRVSDRSTTCIDQVWLNRVSDFESGVFPVEISDHYPIFVILNNSLNINDALIRVEFRCHSKRNIEKFICLVRNFASDFSNCPLSDISLKTKYFMDSIFDLYDKSCPINYKLVSPKKLHSPWVSNELLNKINHKHFLYKQLKRNLCSKDHYRSYRNALCTLIRSTKRNYYLNKFNYCRENTKKTWKCINSFLNKKRVNKCANLLVDDIEVSEPIQIANAFNSYFVNVAQDLANEIPVSGVDPLLFVPVQPNSFFCTPTTPCEIVEIINSFKNKGSDLSTVPPFIYKLIADIISVPLSNLINESFEQGIFPDILKVARVIPLFKSGVLHLLSNYRPISNLHFVSKIFERAMYRRLVDFIEKFEILFVNQFGFRKHRSTDDALIKFTDCIYDSFEKSNYSLSVFLDFSKAFDTIDHSILIKKLERFGIRGNSLRWFESYLSNRYQYVSIGSSLSQCLPILTGVPQGSILGPLLFLLYINDMNKCAPNINFFHFADDTSVVCTGSNLSNVFDVMDSELT